MIMADALIDWDPSDPKIRKISKVWCHLFAQTPEELPELHRIAKAIGMRREWFQNKPRSLPHYDLTPSRRAAALKLGVQEATRTQVVAALRLFRDGTA